MQDSFCSCVLFIHSRLLKLECLMMSRIQSAPACTSVTPIAQDDFHECLCAVGWIPCTHRLRWSFSLPFRIHSHFIFTGTSILWWQYNVFGVFDRFAVLCLSFRPNYVPGITGCHRTVDRMSRQYADESAIQSSPGSNLKTTTCMKK